MFWNRSKMICLYEEKDIQTTLTPHTTPGGEI